MFELVWELPDKSEIVLSVPGALFAAPTSIRRRPVRRRGRKGLKTRLDILELSLRGVYGNVYGDVYGKRVSRSHSNLFFLRAARKKKWPGGETRNGAQSFIVKFAKLRAS